MGIGILPVPHSDNIATVRGTVVRRETSSGLSTGIILQPKPADDPDDPLNWPRWRKELFYLTVLLCTAGMGTNGPLFVPAMQTLAADFGTTLAKISQLNGAAILCLGVSSYVGGVHIQLFGRRSFMLLSLVLFCGGCAWAATSRSYYSLYGARLLQGLGMGSYASLGNTLIQDVFYLHQRGLRIAFWQLSWILSINATPLISSRIISAADWRAAFYAQLGYVAICLGLVLVCGRESLVVRSSGPVPTEDTSAATGLDAEKAGLPVSADPVITLVSRQASPTALWQGRFPTPFGWRDLLRPAGMLLTVPIAWSTVTYSFLFSVLIIGSSVYSQIFAAEPYHLDVSAIGIISAVGPMMGALIGTAGTGLSAGALITRLSTENHNQFEPEMNLIYMLPAAVMSLAGHALWGIGVHRGMPVIVPAIGITIAQAGLSFGICGTIMYASTVLPAEGTDPMSIIMLIRSAFAFGCLFFVNDWLDSRGPLEFFCVLGAVCFALCSVALPLYVWGLRIRYRIDARDRRTSHTRSVVW